MLLVSPSSAYLYGSSNWSTVGRMVWDVAKWPARIGLGALATKWAIDYTAPSFIELSRNQSGAWYGAIPSSYLAGQQETQDERMAMYRDEAILREQAYQDAKDAFSTTTSSKGKATAVAPPLRMSY